MHPGAKSVTLRPREACSNPHVAAKGTNLIKGALARYGRDGVTPFVILFLPRTGSNYLAGMLDTHPEVLCHHELFLPDGIHRSLSVREGILRIDLGSPEERDRDPIAFLRKVYATDEDARAVGFKMSLADPRRGLIASLALNRRVRKIIVRRDNWLQAYTSALIAEQTKQFLRFPDGSGIRQDGAIQVHVDPERFFRYVRKRLLAYRLLRAEFAITRQPSMEIEYGEIQDPAKVRAVLAFLGVTTDVELRPRTTKQNPARLEDRIKNWPEVEARLRGTRYARFLQPE